MMYRSRVARICTEYELKRNSVSIGAVRANTRTRNVHAHTHMRTPQLSLALQMDEEEEARLPAANAPSIGYSGY